MTPAQIRSSVVTERVSWVREMLRCIRALPMTTYEAFIEDPRNVASAESYLRRGIEALLDLGRHILAKGFGIAVTEYKDVGTRLQAEQVLSEAQGKRLRQIAGYRNRMVHFYSEVTREELYLLSNRNLEDLENILEDMLSWLRSHPDKLDQQI